MKNVVINWTVNMVADPNADMAHHFMVALSDTIVMDAPLTDRTVTFMDVAPGVYQASILVADVQNVPLTTPLGFEVTVPKDPTLMPMPVTVNVVIQ